MTTKFVGSTLSGENRRSSVKFSPCRRLNQSHAEGARDPAEGADYWLISRSTTTSEVLCVRITASVLRSGDQRNPVIRFEVKFVI